MQARTDESTMEDYEEIVVQTEVEAEADIRKGDSYMCHHYERNTCLIHFECCPEEVWFPCHKCHNEALGLVENLDEKARENEEAVIDHSDDDNTRATNILGEIEDSSNQAETSSEPEGPHNDASTDGQVKRNKTVTGETSDWPRNNEERSSEESSSMNHTGLHDDPSTREKVETNKIVTGEVSDEPISNNEERSNEENSSINQTCLHDEPSTSEKVERNVDGTSDEPSNDEEGSCEENTSMNQTSLHDDPSTTGEIVERNKTVTSGTSHEPSNDEEGRSEENTSVNETGLHDDPSTSEKVETKAATNGTSHEQSNNEERSSEENASQVPLYAASPSSTENKTRHSVATALDGSRLKCKRCGKEQEFSQSCVSCGNSFATYFCGKCKLLIEKNVDPYHCDDCGICRGNKADHFHCDVCNICMALSLKENHECFADRGHDPCAICLEEVFSGAVIFMCHHMIHKGCAEKLVLSGSNSCPMCRNMIFPEEVVVLEETAQQIPSNEGFNSIHDNPSTSEEVERNVHGTSEGPSTDEEGSSEEDTSINQTSLLDDPSTSETVEGNKTVTGGTSHEPSNDEEGSNEENTSVNETGLHDDLSTSEKVETKTVTNGTSHEQSNNEERSSEENASQEAVVLEETAQQIPSNGRFNLCLLAQKISGLPSSICKWGQSLYASIRSPQTSWETEMTDMSEMPQSEISYTTSV